MWETEGIGCGLRKALGIAGCGVLMLTAAGCTQSEPDQQRVTEVIGTLPGVVSVDASFVGRTMGGGGDTSLGVTVAASLTAEQARELVVALPAKAKEVEHGDGYDEFVILGGRGASRFRFGLQPVPENLVERWVAAAAQHPQGDFMIDAGTPTRPPSATLAGQPWISESLSWAQAVQLADLDWDITHDGASPPFSRFETDAQLTPAMVESWKAIEATYASQDEGAQSTTDTVVVEDKGTVRKVRVAIEVPHVAQEISPSTHGELFWPTVEAIHDTFPPGHRLELQLNRTEHAQRDLVDYGGVGSPEWEAAYRERFPEAVASSATPE